MTKQARTQPEARENFTLKLSNQERNWLAALAKAHGVSRSDAARMLLHLEAERRGWKATNAAP